MISLLSLLENIYDEPKRPTKPPKAVSRKGAIRSSLSPHLQKVWDKSQARKERKNREKKG